MIMMIIVIIIIIIIIIIFFLSVLLNCLYQPMSFTFFDSLPHPTGWGE